MKEQIRAAAIAAALLAASLVSWQVAELSDCRDLMRKGGAAKTRNLRKCPKAGPYGANSNVFLFVLLSDLVPSATAGQQHKNSGP